MAITIGGGLLVGLPQLLSSFNFALNVNEVLPEFGAPSARTNFNFDPLQIFDHPAWASPLRLLGLAHEPTRRPHLYCLEYLRS